MVCVSSISHYPVQSVALQVSLCLAFASLWLEDMISKKYHQMAIIAIMAAAKICEHGVSTAPDNQGGSHAAIC